MIKNNKNRIRFSSKMRDNFIGWFFVTPFTIGLCIFFVFPLVSSVMLSFGGTHPQQAGFHIVMTGLENYKKAFVSDTLFLPKLWSTLKSTVINVPLTLIASLLIAILLNSVKKGKGILRVIVVLPFLLGTGEVMVQLMGQGVDTKIINIANSQFIPREFLDYLGSDFVEVLDLLFGTIVKVLWSSGVQTLLFLSAIQGVPALLYESAKIDGANAYEVFWNITLPMVSPILLLNMVYTIMNSFTDAENIVLEYIQQQISKYAAHGYAAALGWIYFIFVAITLLIGWLLIGGYIKSLNSTGGDRE